MAMKMASGINASQLSIDLRGDLTDGGSGGGRGGGENCDIGAPDAKASAHRLNAASAGIPPLQHGHALDQFSLRNLIGLAVNGAVINHAAIGVNDAPIDAQVVREHALGNDLFVAAG